MQINLSSLYSFEKNTSVGQILLAYFNASSAEELVHIMSEDKYRIINSWSDRTGIEKYKLISILYTAFNSEATFKVEHNFGSNAGYPECSLCFMPNKRFDYNKPILFIFDWPIDED